MSQPTSRVQEGSDFDHEPYKRHKQLLSVLVAVAAMLGYALLSGIVAIEHVKEERSTGNSSLEPQDEEEAWWREEWETYKTLFIWWIEIFTGDSYCEED